MAHLDTTFECKGLSLKNRIVMPPMCQYSVELEDGIPNEWHYVHYVSRAIGGAGLIIVEMTDVHPDGRITNRDLGLWSDDAIPAFKRIVDEVHKYGAKIGIQIAHAGRKAEDAPNPVGASNIPLEGSRNPNQPRALTTEEAQAMIVKFKEAAVRAIAAGFDTIELHGAHGYLIHQFHSPSINNREDQYGQDYALFGVEVIQAVRSVMPADMPLLMRISAVEYIDGGYGLEHSLELGKRYKEAGVDMIHVSSGGEAPPPPGRVPNHAAYQVPLARAFKEALQLPTIAVGRLEEAKAAEEAVANGDADLVAVGRGMLNDPYWALHAIKELSGSVVPPAPYIRGI
ncbi:NADH:flavin oxidoreductase/NADH oxidase [Paenibacillus sp. GXUN7292]|uniref:NADH:flavin oxidoreductase/NADH oxidase n=1 Tax=Paenibacillus sp. GXUN7292 TaxID=3422499 RepID=UPI003D7DEF1C